MILVSVLVYFLEKTQNVKFKSYQVAGMYLGGLMDLIILRLSLLVRPAPGNCLSEGTRLRSGSSQVSSVHKLQCQHVYLSLQPTNEL